MNFFQFHIGDYAQATSHLTLVEDAVYFRLLRRYYAEESPIVDDKRQICRWVEARTDEEKQAVEDVLAEFFELRNGHWHNSRADEEIVEYQQRAETSRVNGRKGGRPRKNPEETQQVNSGNPEETSQQPDGKATKNHEPITNTTTPPTPLAGGREPDPEKRKPRIQLKTFIERCTAAGEKPISEYRPLLDYVAATGLPMDFVQLAWEVFKGEFLDGANASRRQADWRRHFLNYVQKGYYRLWYAKPPGPDGAVEYFLSTQGLQAQAAKKEAA